MKISGIIIVLVALQYVVTTYGQSVKNDTIPLAPEKNRRSGNFEPFVFTYSLEELKENFSNDMMMRAGQQYKMVKKVNQQGKWKPTPESIDSHLTPEWFKDAKFGMFIDWGLWSIAGWAPKKEKGAMYPDWYEYRMDTDSGFIEYHNKNWGKDFKRDDFIPLFEARNYKPERLAKIVQDAGMKYVIPFSKHHSGFCLWPSTFTQRDVIDMGPKTDLIGPLVESCKERGLKFGFYFSVDEWEYPLIDENGKLSTRIWGNKVQPYSKDIEKKASGKIAVRNFAEDYIVPQATEFIDKYDPDILWYDGEWDVPAHDLCSYDIAAYFYNKAEGRKEVAVNDRYGLENGEKLRFKRGDIFTSEYHDNDGKVKGHSWEANRGISQSFGYNWQDTEDNVISTKDFIQMFVDIVSKGGNLLLIVNLDGQGALPKVQEDRLLDIGRWLKVNGEGIYNTRRFSITSEGEVYYTCSKDRQTVYAIATKWPGKYLELKSIVPKAGSRIYLLGEKEPLKWSYDRSIRSTSIEIPDRLQESPRRPCKYAYTFRIEI